MALCGCQRTRRSGPGNRALAAGASRRWSPHPTAGRARSRALEPARPVESGSVVMPGPCGPWRYAGPSPAAVAPQFPYAIGGPTDANGHEAPRGDTSRLGGQGRKCPQSRKVDKRFVHFWRHCFALCSPSPGFRPSDGPQQMENAHLMPRPSVASDVDPHPHHRVRARVVFCKGSLPNVRHNCHRSVQKRPPLPPLSPSPPGGQTLEPPPLVKRWSYLSRSDNT